MPTPKELERKLWSALSSDRTLMLGLNGVEDGHTRPMTALLDGDPCDGGRRSMWFFTIKGNAMVHQLDQGHRAIATFVDKGHDLFAAIHGTLLVESDPAMIDRLWNGHVAAWYEGGRNDPNIVLLRLDPEQAEIWENASSLMAGIQMLFGADPRRDYQDKVARVDLRH